jgi:glucosamine-6-phosphate deaminase
MLERINDWKPTAERPFVMGTVSSVYMLIEGLPTGSSPEGIYERLVAFHKKGELSFKHVITFNMDEYVDLPRSSSLKASIDGSDHEQSYHSFMHKHLFAHIDIDPKNVHILDGNAANLEAECAHYEEEIRKVGGIELFLGGIVSLPTFT